MRRKAKILIATYVIAALTALSLYSFVGQRSLGWYRRTAETAAGLAFEESVRAVESMTAALEQSVYATDAQMADRLCGEISARAAAAEAALATLPFSTEELEQLSAFLNRGGDYALCLCGQEGGVTAEQRETLRGYAKSAAALSAKLEELRTRLGGKELRMDSRELRLRNIEEPDLPPVLSAELLACEAEFCQPETPTYDGRYAQTDESAGESLSEQSALARAAAFLGKAPEELQPAYDYEGADGRRCFRCGDSWLCLSRSGLESLSCSRLVYDAKLSEEEGRTLARELLTKLGFADVQELSAEAEGAVLRLRYAPLAEGVPCVDTPITLSLALDDGSVCRYCAPKAMDLSGASFELDAAAAAAALPDGLRWSAGEQVLRRSPGGRAVPCWRFTAKDAQGRQITVDVHAQSGREYAIAVGAPQTDR